MEKDLLPGRIRESADALIPRLRQCNELSARYGLTLSETQMAALSQVREEALTATGRVEFGVGPLPALIYAFCDSPYVSRDEYADTLAALTELFYAFKNELGNTFSDDELISAMERYFNGHAQGSLEDLQSATPGELYRALTCPYGRESGEESREDGEDEDGEY